MQHSVEEAPLLDDYDLASWAKVGQPAADPLGKVIRQLYGETHLAVVNRLREQMADLAF